MQRREFLGSCLAAVAGAARRPNIALVLIDDLGWMDLGCQGSTFYETPEIDRLAREGARFTNAYSNCPVCSPSRAAILTGRYPARVGFTGHITATGRHRHPENSRIIPPDDYLFLREEEVTLAEALRASGYVSASAGKWHLGSRDYWPEKQGFDANIAGYDHGAPPSYFYPYTNPKQKWNPAIPTLPGGKPGEYLTDRLTDEAIGFIERSRGRPFFVYLSHYAVHTPLQAPQEPVARYEKKLKSDRSQKSAVYGAMVEAVDRGVGRLRAALERLGILDDTLIVVTSDNGGEPRSTSNAPLRDGKGCLYEGGIRVPLIVRWPGRVRKGAVADAPAMGADLYPTILDLAGVKPPRVEVDGVSLGPLLEGRANLAERDLYWYYPHYSPQYGRPGAAVRSGNFKLIQHYDPPGIELYDLSTDPGEKADLASARPQIARELAKKLERHLASVAAIRHTANPARQ
jgi:arylsulfatase A-like enzyme